MTDEKAKCHHARWSSCSRVGRYFFYENHHCWLFFYKTVRTVRRIMCIFADDTGKSVFWGTILSPKTCIILDMQAARSLPCTMPITSISRVSGRNTIRRLLSEPMCSFMAGWSIIMAPRQNLLTGNVTLFRFRFLNMGNEVR